MVLEQKNSWNGFKNNSIFFHLSPTLSQIHPLQVENCDSNSRLVVDEDDSGKLRLERVKYRFVGIAIKRLCTLNFVKKTVSCLSVFPGGVSPPRVPTRQLCRRPRTPRQTYYIDLWNFVYSLCILCVFFVTFFSLCRLFSCVLMMFLCIASLLSKF